MEELENLLEQLIRHVSDDAVDKFGLSPNSKPSPSEDIKSQNFRPKYQAQSEGTSKYQAWSDKNLNETSRRDGSQHQTNRADERESPKHDTNWVDKSQSESPISSQSQRSGQSHWSEKSGYEFPKSGKSQYESTTSDKSQYGSLKGGQSQWAERSQYEIPKSGKSQYESTRSDKTQYEIPNSIKAQYGSTWVDKSQYEKPTKDKYKVPEQSHYEQPTTDRFQNQPLNNTSRVKWSSQPQSETPRANAFEEMRTQEQSRPQRQPEDVIRNVGKMYNISPPTSKNDKDSRMGDESILDKFERFRAQRKAQAQSSKKQSSSENIYKEESRREETNKSQDNKSYNVSRDARTQSARETSSPPRVERQPPPEKKEEAMASDVGTQDKDSEESELEKAKIIPRSMWGALPTMATLPKLEGPADTVVFTLNTNTSPCDTPKECIRRVREVQARQMGEGLGDIQYSFLLGGDGYIYEGRGFDFEGGAKKKGDEGANLNIAFIGRNNADSLSRVMLENAERLVKYSHDVGMLTGGRAREESAGPKTN